VLLLLLPRMAFLCMCTYVICQIVHLCECSIAARVITFVRFSPVWMRLCTTKAPQLVNLELQP